VRQAGTRGSPRAAIRGALGAECKPTGAVANVLLVDDRPENLIALEAILEPLRQNLVRAGSGEEALKRLLNDEFAVILLDAEMPGLDGFETAAHIKRRERTRHVPIVFLTALHTGERHALRGYAAGAVDYMNKPFDPAILRSKVEVFIDLRRQADALAHQALHDALTGLPNRVLFLDRVDLALARLKRRSSTLGVLYFDVDGFKAVNDSFGHGMGDELLVSVAKRVRSVLRPTDTLARLGGDEFTVLAEDLAHPQDLVAIADRIGTAVAVPLQGDAAHPSLTASIGIAVGGEESTPDSLVRDADAAMYLAKRAGGDRYEIFDGEMRRRTRRRSEREHALRRAVEQREFCVHYQPKVNVATGRIEAVEALVRWDSPDRGLLAPKQFIELAEETGIIVPLGAWVLVEALEQARRWRDAHPDRPPIAMAVNLSARQLAAPDLVDLVVSALRDTQTEPSMLCLEVTESVAMGRGQRGFAVLAALNQLGLRLAVDDFGTGYSSLSYLKSFPVDVLKIDRSFVTGLNHHPVNASIVAAVIALAHALDLTAVAEGVETEGELAELRRLECDLAQGYLLGRPKCAAEIERAIAAQGDGLAGGHDVPGPEGTRRFPGA
jgi:diguanylate cyclase (GGDEF)-like protein